jgi:hypothetical protein
METTIVREAPRDTKKDDGRKKAKDSIVGAAKSRQNPPAPPPAAKESNFLLAHFSTATTDFMVAPLDLTKVWEVRAGTLTYDDGGDRSREKDGLERMTAVMGPGSTIRGVAKILTPLFNKVASPPLTAETVAGALTQFNDWALLPDGEAQWQAGVVLLLPIEVPENASVLIVDIDRIKALAKKPDARTPLTVKPVKDLAVPTVDSVTQDVTRKNENSNPKDRGQALARALLANPFEPVFEAIETLRQYARGPGGPSIIDPPTPDEFDCAEGLVEELAIWHFTQLGALTGSNAVLRRLWRTLRPTGTGSSTNADRLAVALGLNLDDDGTWHDPIYFFIDDQEKSQSNAPVGPVPTGPVVVPLELRVPETHVSMTGGKPLVGKTKGVLNKHEMVFGRDLDVGPVRRYQDKTHDVTGTDFDGTISPAVWLGPGIPAKDTTVAAKVAQRLTVVANVAATAGKLDSCRSADPGLLMFGIGQWTVDNNEKGTTFLHRFRQQAPDHFDLHFGRHGLQTVLSAEGPNGEVGDPEGTDRTDAVNKNQPWPVSDTLTVGRPVYVTLRRLLPGDDLVHNSATSLPIGAARREFFGAHDQGGRTFMANDWSARTRLAELLSLEFQRGQLELATLRFDAIVALITGKFPVPGPNSTTEERTMQELFTSEYGAGLIVDTHINAPGDVRGSISRAIAATGGVAVDANGVLDAAWTDRLMTNFLAVRTVDAKIKAARNAALLRMHDKELSAQPGSFTAW